MINSKMLAANKRLRKLECAKKSILGNTFKQIGEEIKVSSTRAQQIARGGILIATKYLNDFDENDKFNLKEARDDKKEWIAAIDAAILDTNLPSDKTLDKITNETLLNEIFDDNRIVNLFRMVRLRTVSDLLDVGLNNLLKKSYFGTKTIEEISKVFHEKGIEIPFHGKKDIPSLFDNPIKEDK
jgi:hypothetical protein